MDFCARFLAMGAALGDNPNCQIVQGPYGMVWALLILLAIGALFWSILRRGEKRDPEEPTPLKILKRRYAKGEITKDEFEEIKKDLGEY